MQHLRLILIIIIFAVASIPFVLSYDPIGKYVWVTLPPAQNATLGGVYRFGCDAGQLAYGITENGTVLCAVP